VTLAAFLFSASLWFCVAVIDVQDAVQQCWLVIRGSKIAYSVLQEVYRGVQLG